MQYLKIIFQNINDQKKKLQKYESVKTEFEIIRRIRSIANEIDEFLRLVDIF